MRFKIEHTTDDEKEYNDIMDIIKNYELTKKNCYLSGCEFNTGCLTNRCKINAVRRDGSCRKYT